MRVTHDTAQRHDAGARRDGGDGQHERQLKTDVRFRHRDGAVRRARAHQIRAVRSRTKKGAVVDGAVEIEDGVLIAVDPKTKRRLTPPVGTKCAWSPETQSPIDAESRRAGNQQ